MGGGRDRPGHGVCREHRGGPCCGRTPCRGAELVVSRENVEFVRRVYALETGDVEGLIELYHEDAEWRDLQHAPDTPEVVRGRAAILALWTQWMEVFDNFTVEGYEYIDAHPWVIRDPHCAGRGGA